MTSHVAVTGMVMVGLIVVGGCTPRKKPEPAAERAAPRGGWVLMHPPEVRDDNYPRGYRIHHEAPLSAWHTDATFATREDCDKAYVKTVDDSIDRAKAVVGDEAKFELPVRRAVQARCVQKP